MRLTTTQDTWGRQFKLSEQQQIARCSWPSVNSNNIQISLTLYFKKYARTDFLSFHISGSGKNGGPDSFESGAVGH